MPSHRTFGVPPSSSSQAFCGELLHPFAKLFCAFSHRESRLLLLTHEGEQGNIKKERFEPGKGAFNYYVDKMKGGGDQKMSVFVHAQGIKSVHARGGGEKMTKFCPRSC